MPSGRAFETVWRVLRAATDHRALASPDGSPRLSASGHPK